MYQNEGCGKAQPAFRNAGERSHSQGNFQEYDDYASQGGYSNPDTWPREHTIDLGSAKADSFASEEGGGKGLELRVARADSLLNALKFSCNLTKRSQQHAGHTGGQSCELHEWVALDMSADKTKLKHSGIHSLT